MKFNWPEFEVDFNVPPHTILLSLAGSKAYGTDHPLSDTDYKGILIPPRAYTLSPFKTFEQISWKGEGETGRVSERTGDVEADEEGTIFGLQKFMRLASTCNPNVVELLFVDEKHLVILSEEGRLLRDNRHLFLSQKALKTFTGYALSQLKRIKSHKSWIDKPPKELPTREEFGLPKEKIIRPDQLQAAEAFIERNTNALAPWLLEQDSQHQAGFWEGLGQIFTLLLQESDIERDFDAEEWMDIRAHGQDKVAQSLGFDANFIEYLKKEKAYAQKRQHFKQYKAWLRNRNPARAELEARYGYDCKHAMHLVRLLRMGEEILTTGDFNVYRPDREELRGIRNGSWSYEKLVSWSDERVEYLYDLVRKGNSVVPVEPNLEEIENLAIEVQDKFRSSLFSLTTEWAALVHPKG
jgi:predicted nucleotidyltransferase